MQPRPCLRETPGSSPPALPGPVPSRKRGREAGGVRSLGPPRTACLPLDGWGAGTLSCVTPLEVDGLSSEDSTVVRKGAGLFLRPRSESRSGPASASCLPLSPLSVPSRLPLAAHSPLGCSRCCPVSAHLPQGTRKLIQAPRAHCVQRPPWLLCPLGPSARTPRDSGPLDGRRRVLTDRATSTGSTQRKHGKKAGWLVGGCPGPGIRQPLLLVQEGGLPRWERSLRGGGRRLGHRSIPAVTAWEPLSAPLGGRTPPHLSGLYLHLAALAGPFPMVPRRLREQKDATQGPTDRSLNTAWV